MDEKKRNLNCFHSIFAKKRNSHGHFKYYTKQAHISYEAKTARDLLVAIGTFVAIGAFNAIGTFVANGTFEAIWNKICKSADDTPRESNS